jgi:hypothetical protein
LLLTRLLVYGHITPVLFVISRIPVRKKTVNPSKRSLFFDSPDFIIPGKFYMHPRHVLLCSRLVTWPRDYLTIFQSHQKNVISGKQELHLKKMKKSQENNGDVYG